MKSVGIGVYNLAERNYLGQQEIYNFRQNKEKNIKLWCSDDHKEVMSQEYSQKSTKKSQYLDFESYIQAPFLVISVNKPHLYASNMTISQFSCNEENG